MIDSEMNKDEMIEQALQNDGYAQLNGHRYYIDPLPQGRLPNMDRDQVLYVFNDSTDEKGTK